MFALYPGLKEERDGEGSLEAENAALTYRLQKWLRSGKRGFTLRNQQLSPGHKSWFEDSYKCFSYWRKVGNGCAICLASCPYTKAASARARDYAHLQDLDQWWTLPAIAPRSI